MPGPTKAQHAQAQTILDHRVVDPIDGGVRCRWCLHPSHVVGDDTDFLCGQCGRWQGAKAFPDGVPGLTQVPETCAHCGHASEWAPDEADGMKRCPACRSDMHPRAALELHGQAILPTGGRARASVLRLASKQPGVGEWTTVTDQAALPPESS
jgi:hypothetical protein